MNPRLSAVLGRELGKILSGHLPPLGNQLPEYRPQQVSVEGRTTAAPRLRITFPIGQEDPG